MHVSRLGNHSAETLIAPRGEGRNPASDVGRLGFAGLVRQLLKSAGRDSPLNSVASSILAACEANAAASAQALSVVAANAPTAASVAPPADAPHPAGTGQVTESGAPRIALNSEISWDHRDFDGPAAYNPYYATSLSPTREGYVEGFDKWFQSITVGPENNNVWPAAYSATEEGAQEALRIVQQYVPDAKILAYRFVGQEVGPLSHAIELPNGMRLNAGLLLDAYYHQGFGVNSLSDAELRVQLDWPADAPAPSRAV